SRVKLNGQLCKNCIVLLVDPEAFIKLQMFTLPHHGKCYCLPTMYFRTDLVALNLFNVALGSCIESHEFWRNFLSRRCSMRPLLEALQPWRRSRFAASSSTGIAMFLRR